MAKRKDLTRENLEALGTAVADAAGDVDAYLTVLRQRHPRKTGFWSQVRTS